MKYMLFLCLLFVTINNFGMAYLKEFKKQVTAVYRDLSKEVKTEAQKMHDEETHSKPAKEESRKSKPLPAIPHTYLMEYQRTQRQNINGFLIALFAAGVCKLNAVQSHPASDTSFNFNMATFFSLGVSATCAYKFFTTRVPAQIEHK